MTLQQMLSDYGYLAVFIGCLLEGETILVLAGFAAHQGYLSLPVVMLIALVGGTLGDQMFFFIGRYWGAALLGRVRWLAKRAPAVNRLMLKYDAALIVGVRFMYGLRIAGPIVIGMSDVRKRRFLLFNVIGAAIWSVLIPGAGYLFGQSLQLLLVDVEKYEGVAAVLLIALAVGAGLLHRYLSHRRKALNSKPADSAARDVAAVRPHR
jgi:membrane protein DedA with SNARE-associated domain